MTVTSLITYLYLAALFGVIFAWRWYATPFGLLNTLILHGLLYGVAVAYRNTIRTPPGYAPRDYVPPGVDRDELERIRLRDLDKSTYTRSSRYARGVDAPRYCAKCKAWKPPRAQHCRDCNRCVLLLDHHCPWVNNCVGANNHRYFVQFLAYASVGMLYVGALLIWRLVDFFRRDAPRGKPLDLAQTGVMVVLLLAVVLDFMVLLGVTGLFCYQCELISANTTSLEANHKSFEQSRAPNNGAGYEWPYDLGCKRNWVAFLGRTWREWLLPCVPLSRRASDDGLTFPLNPDYLRKKGDA